MCSQEKKIDGINLASRVCAARPIALIFLAVMIVGCTSSPPQQQIPAAPTGTSDALRQLNEGYSLLYKLMSDESDVAKIFILKHPSDSVAAPVKEIGNAAQAARKKMDELAKQDSRLSYQTPDLPYIEQRSRDLQASAYSKTLLLSGGKEFETRLIFSQLEAMNYAVQLCNALDEKEQDANRKAFLKGLQKQCQDFHDRLTKLLSISA